MHACTSRGATCIAKQGRIVQAQNFIFLTIFQFFLNPNQTWTHPPTSNFFLDYWHFFNFAKPLRWYDNNENDVYNEGDANDDGKRIGLRL